MTSCQVPHAELETWLVQQEPVERPEHPPPLSTAPGGIEGGRTALPGEGEEDHDEEVKLFDSHTSLYVCVLAGYYLFIYETKMITD